MRSCTKDAQISRPISSDTEASSHPIPWWTSSPVLRKSRFSVPHKSAARLFDEKKGLGLPFEASCRNASSENKFVGGAGLLAFPAISGGRGRGIPKL